MRRELLSFFPTALLFFGLCQPATGAPRAELWERWLASDEKSGTRVNHDVWNRLLGTYVETDHPSGVNRFRYGEVSTEDRSALAGYIDYLAGLSPTGLARREQLAYWINLYNALTVRVVLEHYPVDSIRDIDISPGFFTDGPWGADLLEIEREKVSLDDVEHRILRPIWKDSRIHYAVNCASVGCPDLQPVAYEAENTEMLLEKGARAYVNHPRGVRYEREKLLVSSIYHWFVEDFGGTEEGIIRHLLRYVDEPLRSRLQNYRTGLDDGYDWGLNDP